MSDPDTVKVALRIRPLVENELNRGCTKCLSTIQNENQVQINGTDKAFTFNYVFDETASQEQFYKNSVQSLVSKLFRGYNVTILAYGQTGSGKTHSMGTNYQSGNVNMGVIPRAIHDIFTHIDENSEDFEFRVTVSFMELYNENLYDLLAARPKEQCVIDIREGEKGIKIPGLFEQSVSNIDETIKCLIDGSNGRATGATAMNAQSSRSHAIFTINIFMQKMNQTETATNSKFHLVDLAGSERSKKTKATGKRFQEGVNINRGLLALGNVISALGDDLQRGFISYRDSKLTRLLQDSLGGNSMTLMIACVSPADYNLDETLSTLRYADRARKIRNKPIINQDPKIAEIARLQQIINQLRLERLAAGGDSKLVQHPHNSEQFTKLERDNEELQKKNRQLNAALSTALAENTSMFERTLLQQAANEKMKKKLLELKESYNVTLSNLNLTMEHNKMDDVKVHFEKLDEMKNLINTLQIDQERNEEELQKHEYQIASSSTSTCSSSDLLQPQPEIDQRQEEHVKEQLELNTELKELTRALAIKEQLASQMMVNVNHLIDYTAFNDNENKVQSLEKEREELLQQLKQVHTKNVSSKLSEQRRKRVKELETEINELKKKLTEMTRLIKLKEKDNEKIKKLMNEIQDMKHVKIKLIRTMRAEEQTFKAWKSQREMDLMRLKDKDRKRQNQMIRMECMHQKQQVVLKRKIEEAAAINKRLKDALMVQKQAQERRAQNGNKIERIEHWVSQEVEVLISTVDAEWTLKQLMDDRALLHNQLSRLRDDPNGEPEHVQQLTEDIELRNAQIADFQQRIMDSDQDNKSRTRWDTIQTMVEAKHALKKLFDFVAEMCRDSVVNKCKLNELQQTHEETNEQLNGYELKLKEQCAKYEHGLSENKRQYEEKVTVLLKQLRGISSESEENDLKDRIRIQDDLIDQMEELRKQIKHYEDEIADLTKRLEQNPVPKGVRPEKSHHRQLLDITYLKGQDDFESEEEGEDDDKSKDPDWMNTPMGKQLVSLSGRHTNIIQNPGKRSSDERKCNCKTKCKSNMCSCRKIGVVCSEKCKCSKDRCENLKPVSDQMSDDNNSEESIPTVSVLSEHNFKNDPKKKRLF